MKLTQTLIIIVITKHEKLKCRTNFCNSVPVRLGSICWPANTMFYVDYMAFNHGFRWYWTLNYISPQSVINDISFGCLKNYGTLVKSWWCRSNVYYPNFSFNLLTEGIIMFILIGGFHKFIVYCRINDNFKRDLKYVFITN